MNNKALKLYLFCCSTSFDSEDLIQGCSEQGDEFKAILLPCSGKVDTLYLTKTFETGADGAIIVTCKQGECRYLEGNLRAWKRAEAVDTLLEEIGLGKGRMMVIEMDDGGIEKVIRKVEDFRAKIKALPKQVSNTGIEKPVYQS